MSRINTVSMEKFKWRKIYVVINSGSDSYSFCCRGQLPLFNGHQWKQYIDRMNKEDPDVVLIVWDFVDDDTTKDDMIASCKVLWIRKKRQHKLYCYLRNFRLGIQI